MLVDLSQMIGTYLQDVFVTNLDWWVVLGVIAQIFFTARFVVQWLASERAGRSVIPVAFWILSLVGGLMLLTYAIYRKDPVFIAGQTFGVFVYLRNLQLVLRGFRRMPARVPA
ncbi:MAG: lipid-A-disaccharide synthase N-terminal domain-containing protein [Pseudorhodoplanes sp.]